MTLNLCQIIILLCIVQGVIYIAVLLLSRGLRTHANVYLALLILALAGNLLQYWLRDVGLITDKTLQLLFLPWQILVAPFFWLYIRSLQIFNLRKIPHYLLWAPIALLVLGHMIIKGYLLVFSPSSEAIPNWINNFNLIEEFISIAYCIIISIAAFLTIRSQRKLTNYQGFGINKDIITSLRLLAIQGIALCSIWLISLWLFDLGTISNYYTLWIVSGIAINVLGINGIYNSLKHGPYLIATLPTKASIKSPDLPKSIKSFNPKLSVASPAKHFDQSMIDALMKLSTNLSALERPQEMLTLFKQWLQKEFDIAEINFLTELLPRHLKGIAEISTDNQRLIIPYRNRDHQLSAFQVEAVEGHTFDQQHLYYLKMAAKAYSFHIGALTTSKNIVTSDNPHFVQISSWMDQEQLFKDPQLDLSSLAKRLKISDGYLSKMINEISGRHFNDWLNGYRIDYAKTLMSDKSFDHYSISGYGYESGFNSKSTFYKAFQKNEEISPGAYKKSLIKREQVRKDFTSNN